MVFQLGMNNAIIMPRQHFAAALTRPSPARSFGKVVACPIRRLCFNQRRTGIVRLSIGKIGEMVVDTGPDNAARCLPEYGSARDHPLAVFYKLCRGPRSV